MKNGGWIMTNIANTTNRASGQTRSHCATEAQLMDKCVRDGFGIHRYSSVRQAFDLR